MKHLILVRHGKSAWEYPVRDHDRVLLQRGIQDAHMVGEHLKQLRIKPDFIWTSTAARALQTATLVTEYLDYGLKSLELKRELYTFDEQQLLEVVRSCSVDADTLMLFSHNNGLTELANSLGNQRFENIPTTGVVAIDFETTSWKALTKGTTLFHVFPKELRP
jgi:phosphohistidine phosphatase